MRVWLQFVEPLLREIKAGKMPTVSRPRGKGRPRIYVPCPHCGRTVTTGESMSGHPGCTRVKRRYTLPGRRKAKPKEKEIVLTLTKEDIRKRIEGMSTTALGRVAERIMRAKGAGKLVPKS